MEKSDWFTSWFKTPYYHILYKDRNDADAQLFMQNITEFLALPKEAHILDLPCGKGRHSIYLNKIGFDVTGIDLSQNSIDFAKQYENDTLKFKRHDMCQPLDSTFNAVFNLFTSFGYFEKDESNIQAIKAMKANMKPEAYGVIDFLNIHYTIKHLKVHEIKVVDDIEFEIEKWTENGYLFKRISFDVENEKHSYTERLKCIDLELFTSYFKKAGLLLESTYGDYSLNPFDIENSQRLILVFRK